MFGAKPKIRLNSLYRKSNQVQSGLRSMATERHIELSPQIQQPVYSVPDLSTSSARKASDLLNDNHIQHHIFFNNAGFHNHIVHHVLTSYALGADPPTLQKNYDDNVNYQNRAKTLKNEQKIIESLHDPAMFIKTLGPNSGQCYTKFLAFFQSEIATKGWEQVVNEYLFADDERAQKLLARLFAGFQHSMIHFGFGVEFEQPAIIAEGLAEAAAHGGDLEQFFKQAEQKANDLRRGGKEPRSLMDILKDIQEDSELIASTRWADDNKIRHGVLARAPDRMIEYASQWYVRDESELEKRTAEMIHLCAYYAAASQQPNKTVKFDFFNIHAINCSIFFSKFLDLPFFSAQNKIRILEWKARTDLVLFVASHSPRLSPDTISNFQPVQPYPKNDVEAWASIYDTAVRMDDDGHVPKLIRALAHAKEVCIKYEDDKSLGFAIRGNAWTNVGKIAIESVHSGGPMLVRGAGWEEAWRDVPDHKARVSL